MSTCPTRIAILIRTSRKLSQPTEALLIEFRKSLDQEKVKAFVRESKKQGILLYSAQDMVEEFSFSGYEESHAQYKTPSPVSRNRKAVGSKRVSAIHTPPYVENNSEVAIEASLGMTSTNELLISFIWELFKIFGIAWSDDKQSNFHPASSFSVRQNEEQIEGTPFSKRQGAKSAYHSYNTHILNGDQASWANLSGNESPEVKILSKVRSLDQGLFFRLIRFNRLSANIVTVCETWYEISHRKTRRRCYYDRAKDPQLRQIIWGKSLRTRVWRRWNRGLRYWFVCCCDARYSTSSW